MIQIPQTLNRGSQCKCITERTWLDSTFRVGSKCTRNERDACVTESLVHRKKLALCVLQMHCRVSPSQATRKWMPSMTWLSKRSRMSNKGTCQKRKGLCFKECLEKVLLRRKKENWKPLKKGSCLASTTVTTSDQALHTMIPASDLPTVVITPNMSLHEGGARASCSEFGERFSNRKRKKLQKILNSFILKNCKIWPNTKKKTSRRKISTCVHLQNTKKKESNMSEL